METPPFRKSEQTANKQRTADSMTTISRLDGAMVQRSGEEYITSSFDASFQVERLLWNVTL